MPPINFFEFRRLVNAGELDGVIIAEKKDSSFTKAVIQNCKFYDVPKVGIGDLSNFNPFNPVFMLNSDKVYLPYLETNLIDGCNLNCKGCTHFSVLFNQNEIYPFESFHRDIRRISQICDVHMFRLLGGEPLLLKNLDRYIKVARDYLPKTDLRVVTNALLIPTLSQTILDAIRENHCIIDISAYAPTLKIADRIREILSANKIPFNLSNYAVDKFGVFLTLHSGNNPIKSRAVCFNDGCRFMRDGKIYKCPLDAFSHKFSRRFGIKNFPASVGIDIFDPNFPTMIQMLDDNIELCHWCGEKVRQIPWKPTNNPQLEDWLADPDELKNFS